MVSERGGGGGYRRGTKLLGAYSDGLAYILRDFFGYGTTS